MSKLAFLAVIVGREWTSQLVLPSSHSSARTPDRGRAHLQL